LKIAMFTDSFHPTVDGAVVAMERQCRSLEAKGHEVVMLAPRPSVDVKTRWPTHYLPSMEFRSYKGYRIVVSPSDMLEYLRGQSVDIIHCHGLASMAILSLTAGKALGLPTVLTFHTMANEAVRYYSFIGVRDDLVVPLVWVYLRNLLKRPEMVVFPSKPIEKELLEHGIRTKAHAVVPTGVDRSLYSPANRDAAVLAKHGLEGKRVMLHVGRLSLEKRLDIVLHAMKQLTGEEPDLRLLVIGSGPAENEYRRLTRDLGIDDRVVFTGFAPDDFLVKAYATCDMLVLASTFETQGLVILEAMASGTPVAGMRCRAIPEFVTEGHNGTLFDESSCAEGIRRCLGSLDDLRKNSLQTAVRYSADACIDRLVEAYERAKEVKTRSLARTAR
jgi:1,2-diacylglycerol 3-alpha-glucosyltransferase